MLPFPSNNNRIVVPPSTTVNNLSGVNGCENKAKNHSKVLTLPNNNGRGNATHSNNAGSTTSTTTTAAAATTTAATNAGKSLLSSSTTLVSSSSTLGSSLSTIFTSGSVSEPGSSTNTNTNNSNNNGRVTTIPLSNNGSSSVVNSEKSQQQSNNGKSQLVSRRKQVTTGPKQASSSSSTTTITTPTRRIEQSGTTRLSTDSTLSIDIDLSKKKKKKRKIIEDESSPDISSYFQSPDDEESSTSHIQYTPQVYFTPPVFQPFDCFPYPHMMAVNPQYLTNSSANQSSTINGSASTRNNNASQSTPKQFESEDEYWGRKPTIAQFMEKRLGFTRYVIDRLDDRELSHQFIHCLISSKDKAMIGSLCMSLLSTYLQEIKNVAIPELSFQDSTNQNGVQFNVMGASIEYSALISRIVLMSCDPHCKSNKVADLLALSFMLIFNFGSYCRCGSTAPNNINNK